jgi:uncharacterized membrane protein
MEWVEVREWLLIFHVMGFIMWVGSMIGCTHILGAHAVADGGKKAFESLEKNLGIAMDVGATLTIATGLYMALGGPLNFFVKDDVGSAFLHGKVGLVVLGLISIHVFLRMKIRKFRNGDVAPIPVWLFPVLMLVLLNIVYLVFKRPF